MKGFCLFALLLAANHVLGASAVPERPYINDLKAPTNRADLQAIQDLLLASMQRVTPATVAIEVGDGSGSGVIVSPDGLVLTAAHVSSGVQKDLTVILNDGRRLKGVSLGLVASCDAAMIQILETVDSPFPYVEIDRSASTRLGDWVFSLGHSGGYDEDRGAVARIGRMVRIAHETYQSDCLLIGGDSGGPLFDLNGRLIGIHSRVGEVLQENMHVPIQQFLDHWDGMLASEFIGEGPFATKPEKGSGFLGLATEGHPEGLQVMKVGPGSPAASAGIKEGDIIKSFNGAPLTSRKDLQAKVRELAAGDAVQLEMLIDGKAQTLTLKLGER